jgi:hypothetical protein
MFCRTFEEPCDISGIGSNIISNPGAENGSTDWGFDIRNGDYAYPGEISSSVAHSGSKSFKITCTGNAGWSRWYRTTPDIAVTQGAKYAVRVWVRATTGACGEIWIINGSANLFLNYESTNDQWVRLVLPEFTAASNSIHIYLQDKGIGTVYFDDVFIAKLP